ncbi:hypothetical protein SAMN04488137_2972 [Fictibacillus solisalsi]|uniref:Uncharacterized protein n=1 Tax=Fictibacillus solisalsi TaxID=459525 RepID=A0A1G9XRR7_9BACL|nr:hypothetical protein [Fictibacillus solisalsi]SDM99529.1 hypothetical protein SAMN04488137_2972 [Fictibacillus solisalsi]
MIVNRGGALGKDYFVSYLRLIMNARNCSVMDAHEVAMDIFFHGDNTRFGISTFEQFQSAFHELSK